MAVIQLKSEPKCKLCQHPQRDAIDALLEMRANRQKDENGVLVNGDYVLAQLASWEVVNPTRENITNHWRKHCQRVSGAAGEAMDKEQGEAYDALLAILNSEDYPDTLDGKLRRIFDLGFAEVVLRIRRGERSGITLDQLRWVSAELTRRQHNESQADLLAALAGGIAVAEISAVKATVSARPLPAPAPELPLAAEDADFEVVGE